MVRLTASCQHRSIAVQDSLESVATIADRTMRWGFRMWGFGEAIALEGLLAASRTTGQREYETYVEALCRATVGRGLGHSADDHLAPGRVFLLLHALTHEDLFLDAAKTLVGFHERLPTTADGALLVRHHQAGWAGQLWVDSMDIIGPLYSSLSETTGEAAWQRRAVDLTLAHAGHLQRKDGLFSHGYDVHAGPNGQPWARGQGWALLGMSSVLSHAQHDAHRRSDLHARCLSLVDALVSTQRPSGLWSTVVTNHSTYEESTLAAMFVCALNTLERVGMALSQPALAARKRARAEVLRRVDESGALGLVSCATPVGELSTYATRPFGVFPWGQGPLLLMKCNT